MVPVSTLPNGSAGTAAPALPRRRLRAVSARFDAPRTRLTALLSRVPGGSGVAPFFLSLDVLAWAVGSSVAASLAPADVVHLVLLVALLAEHGAYRSRLTLSVLVDWPQLVGRSLAAAALVVALAVVLPLSADAGDLLRTGASVAAAVVALRAVGYAVVRQARARGHVGHRTLVLGAGRVGAHLVRTLKEHREYGLVPVGFLDSTPLLRGDALPAPVLGGDEELAAVIAERGIDVVVVAFGSLRGEDLVEVLRTCDRLQVEIFLVPRLFELHAVGPEMDAVWGLPLIRQRRAPFRTVMWRVKRGVDVVVSALALLLLSPLLAAIALAVRLEGGSGVLFRQTRVGMDARPFELLKFRSLRPVDEAESATRWTITHDERLGPVGRFLRSTSLDELPQLWNILRGDMSLVGPRPERPHFVSTFSSTLPRYLARHRVPAGLTGWAQVHGLRGDTSIEDRARFDNYYIENWSLGLDLRILLLTVASVLTRRGG
jgi:exopolysaccharide biosynthesis polyprenyl glycosylphosphotransferase